MFSTFLEQSKREKIADVVGYVETPKELWLAKAYL